GSAMAARSYLDPPTLEDDGHVADAVRPVDAHLVPPEQRDHARVRMAVAVRLAHAHHGDPGVDRAEERGQGGRAAVVRHLEDGRVQEWALVSKHVRLVLLL